MRRNEKPAAGGQEPALAALTRDAALARISRTRRWMIAGVAALTAGFAALASALLPGKSLGAKSHAAATSSTPATARSSTGTPQLPAPAGAAQLGLQSPSQSPQPASPQPSPQESTPQGSAPQPAPAPATGGGVVSGGS